MACHNGGMNEAELLKRFDRHLERGEELMRENREAFDRNTEAFDRNTEAFNRFIEASDRHGAAFERFKSAHDDLREFIREITVRIERGTRTQVQVLNRLSEAVVDMKDEIHANTQAVLNLLDRYFPPPDSAPA